MTVGNHWPLAKQNIDWIQNTHTHTHTAAPQNLILLIKGLHIPIQTLILPETITRFDQLDPQLSTCCGIFCMVITVMCVCILYSGSF